VKNLKHSYQLSVQISVVKRLIPTAYIRGKV
jgi:hypothetical protein